MMMEWYPNLKEEVGGSIPNFEISLSTWLQTYQVVNRIFVVWHLLVGLLSQK